jgi:hypothetical protein
VPAKAVERPGEVEQLRSDLHHPTFVVDGAELAMSPPLQRLMPPADGFAKLSIDGSIHTCVGRVFGPFALLIPRMGAVEMASVLPDPIIPAQTMLKHETAEGRNRFAFCSGTCSQG